MIRNPYEFYFITQSLSVYIFNGVTDFSAERSESGRSRVQLHNDFCISIISDVAAVEYATCLDAVNRVLDGLDARQFLRFDRDARGDVCVHGVHPQVDVERFRTCGRLQRGRKPDKTQFWIFIFCQVRVFFHVAAHAVLLLGGSLYVCVLAANPFQNGSQFWRFLPVYNDV